ATDEANASFERTHEIRLYGETAAGKYPVESVLTMSRIAEKAESALNHREIFMKQQIAQETTVTEAISQSVAISALDLNAKAIISSTVTGHTARVVSKYRPKSQIIAVTTQERTMRQLALVWGVTPVHGLEATSTDELLETALKGGKASGLVKAGDLVVITAGIPLGRSGSTNLVKVDTIPAD
ncbi:pyruvate kinase, partial [Paenibacillus riograndensis]